MGKKVKKVYRNINENRKYTRKIRNKAGYRTYGRKYKGKEKHHILIKRILHE